MAHVLACPRIPVAQLHPNIFPHRYIEALEQNQQVMSCCRHPENHLVEAWYSNETEAAAGRADVYIFICTEVHPDSIRPNGERWHMRYCAGETDTRPFWRTGVNGNLEQGTIELVK